MKSIIQRVSIALAACMAALAGYWYIQTLNTKIDNLERSLQNVVEALADVQGAVSAQNTALKNWRASQERLEASQKETRNRIEYVLKTTKGNARVVDSAVIDELCNGAGRKYCAESVYASKNSGANNANNAVQRTKS